MERKVCTIGEWLDVWYEVYAVPEYASKTLEIYRDARKRLSRRFPEIESTLLTELLPVTFQKALNDLSKKYAKSSLRHIKSLYNLAYQTAIKNHQCTENPISSVTVPKKASEKVVSGLSREEQQAFEEAAKQLTIRDQFILQTFLLTGLRRGELQNLRWQDWDKKAKVLRVEKSKTENGIRKVPIADKVLPFYQRWLHDCSDCEYLIHTLDSQHFTYYMYYHNVFQPLMFRLHIDHTPHCCRHTTISLLAEAHVDQTTIKKIVGHSGAMSLTERIYTHLDVPALVEAINQI